MKLLPTIFTSLRGIGSFGSGMLFLYIEWTYLHPNWTQLLNPVLQLQVLNRLLAAPLFWLFLAASVVGYYGAARTRRIEKQQRQPQKIEQRELQKVGTASSRPPAIRQTATVEPAALVSEALPHTVFQKVLQSDAATKQKLELLEWAIQSSQKLEFDYENRYGAKSHRLVIPIEFKVMGQALCLVGFCRLRKAKRIFAIKRMANIKLIPTNQADYLLPSLQGALLDSTEQDTANLRPFLKYYVDELERIANLEWHNREVLTEIQNELNFRSRKKARELRERIARRLTELQKIARPSAKIREGG